MHLKLLSLAAIAALVTACGTTSDEECATSGQGYVAEAVAVHHHHAPGSVADFVEHVGDRVFFDYDKDSLRDAGVATLSRQAEWLKRYDGYTVTLQGHCDKRGTVEYNYALGERRANASKRQLMAFGIPDSRIKVVSYGKERPIVLGESEWDFQQNRTSVTVLDH